MTWKLRSGVRSFHIGQRVKVWNAYSVLPPNFWSDAYLYGTIIKEADDLHYLIEFERHFDGGEKVIKVKKSNVKNQFHKEYYNFSFRREAII